MEDLIDRDLSCSDFEDNLQLACASDQEVFTLVTLNKCDFGCAEKFQVEVLSPLQLLARLGVS